MSENVLDPKPFAKRDSATERLPLVDAAAPIAGGDHTHRMRSTQHGPGAMPRVAGYEILEELGRGGMGIVYKAWQQNLRRPVALKMILAGSFAGDHDLDRFRAEAMAIARLHHPHLLSIYEIGDGPVPFYAMEYMEGGSLARRLNGQPIAPRSAAGLVRALAEAMDYAHKNGIVHRDLKPANILLSGTDTTPIEACVAKITDFGIAKHLHEASHLTRTGDILGSPHYMAPEQATGLSGTVGPTADVYSLGAILYELLTGRAPFHGSDGAAILLRLTCEEPERPSHWARGVPADLETICLKCLEKHPTRRYASGAALAEDLKRFLNNEPIQAKPRTLSDRAIKWARRRPGRAAVLTMTAALVLFGFGMMAIMWRQAVEHAGAQSQLLNQSRAQLADAYLERGIHLAEKGDVRRGMHLMVRALEIAEEVERVDPRAPSLSPAIRANLTSWSQCVGTVEKHLSHDNWVWDLAFSPDRKFVLTASRDRNVTVWDCETGEQVGPSLTHPYPVWGLALHPDGQTLFTLSTHDEMSLGQLTVWSADPARPGHFTPRGEPMKFALSLGQLRLSVQGDRLWMTEFTQGRSLLLAYDPRAAGNGLSVLKAIDGSQVDAVFSPDGAALATVVAAGAALERTGEVRLWNTNTGAPIGRGLCHSGPVRALTFSKDSQHLIVGCATEFEDEQGESSRLHIWHWADQKMVSQSPALFGQIKTIAMAPSGQMFAASVFEYVWTKDKPRKMHITDGQIGLWQLHADGQIESYGSPLRTDGAVWSIAFSPDSRLLLAGCRTSGAFLWSVSNCQRLMPPIWHEGNCVKVAFRSDGRQAVTASAGGNNHASARLWDVPSFAHIGPPLPQPTGIRSAFWESDGQHVWVTCGKTLGQWDPFHGVRTEAHVLPSTAYYVHPTADDRRLFLEIGKDDLHTFERATGAIERLSDLPTPPRAQAQYTVHRDRRIFLQSWQKPCQIRIHTLTGQPLTPFVEDADFERSASVLSESGDLLAVGQRKSGHPVYRIRLYDTSDLSMRREFELKQPASVLALSLDAKSLAISGTDRQVRFLNLDSGQFEGAPLLHETKIHWVRFINERLLASMGDKGRILLWDVPSGKRVGPAFEHGADLISTALRPQGDYLLTGANGRMAMAWRLPTPAAGSLTHLRVWVEAITGLEMKDDDAIVPIDMDRLLARRRQVAKEAAVVAR